MKEREMRKGNREIEVQPDQDSYFVTSPVLCRGTYISNGTCNLQQCTCSRTLYQLGSSRKKLTKVSLQCSIEFHFSYNKI